MLPDDSSMLKIGNKKQVFFDDLILEMVQDITRKYYSPEKSEQNPLIKKDRPWEHVILCRTNSYRVLYDKIDKLFKCWYSDEGIIPQNLTDTTNVNGEECHPMLSLDYVIYRLLYAYSEDGITWTKPDLSKHLWDGEKTNIIWGDSDFGSVYACHVVDDPFEDDPKKRFKTLYVRIGKNDIYRIEAAYSEDGVNWTTYEELPSFGKHGPHLEDVAVVNYDLDSRLYILTTRHDEMTKAHISKSAPVTNSFFPPYFPGDFSKENRRRVFQCESSDFIHWSEPYLILAPDEFDNIDDTLYGMVRYRIGDLWVGVVMVLHQVEDTMEAQLAYSRDGKNWKRVHKPLLLPGGKGEWDQIMVEMVNDPLEVGDELWFYYGASGWGHHDWYSRGIAEGLDVAEAKEINKVGFFLGLAKLRLDGFCSLSAGKVREGVIVTRPIISLGDRLVLNCRTGEGGSVRVEVTDGEDNVFPGYSKEDCDVFSGDNVRHTVTWKGKKEMPAARYRKLRFFLRDAELFSLQVMNS